MFRAKKLKRLNISPESINHRLKLFNITNFCRRSNSLFLMDKSVHRYSFILQS